MSTLVSRCARSREMQSLLVCTLYELMPQNAKKPGGRPALSFHLAAARQGLPRY